MFQLIFEEVLVGLALWVSFGRTQQRALNAMLPMELVRYLTRRRTRAGWLTLAYLAANLGVIAWAPMSAEGLSWWEYAGCCLTMLGPGVLVALLLHDAITLVRSVRLRGLANREHQAAVRWVTGVARKAP
jgi:hypothetical protein